ncbi:glycine zipper 2TM domain-containing protein [Qipengyuania sp. CAU 1752]
MFKTFSGTALAIAASGMVVATPVAAAPINHSAPVTQSTYAAPGYANSAWETETAEHHRRWHKKGKKAKHGYRDYDDRRYDDRRYDDRRYDDRRYDDRRYQSQNYYGEPVRRDTRVWRGQDGSYYCRKSDGTTGLLIGGAVGALAGREIARDRTLGAILGGAAGALLGREIDRGNSRCR